MSLFCSRIKRLSVCFFVFCFISTSNTKTMFRAYDSSKYVQLRHRNKIDIWKELNRLCARSIQIIRLWTRLPEERTLVFKGRDGKYIYGEIGMNQGAEFLNNDDLYTEIEKFYPQQKQEPGQTIFLLFAGHIIPRGDPKKEKIQIIEIAKMYTLTCFYFVIK